MNRAHRPDTMQNQFHASFVALEDDGEAWLIRFADAEFNPSRHVTLQRTQRPSALDVELGFAGHHIEVDDENQSGYGGVASAELYGDRIEIMFDEDGIATLGGRERIVIRFALRERQLDQLRGYAAQIFAQSDCFQDCIE